MSTEELQRLRAEMDAINRELLAVLQRRAGLVRRIATHKRAAGLPLVDAEREQQMLAELLAAAGDGYEPAALQRILEAVFAASRELVQQPPPA